MIRLRLLLAVVVTLSVGTPAWAAPQSSPNLVLHARVDSPRPHLVVLSATLRSRGEPIGKARVEYFIATTTFGPALMQVGTASTDASGTAILSYRPTWTGRQEFVAQYRQRGMPAAIGRTWFSATRAGAAYSPPRLPIPGVRRWLVRVLVGAVLLVWAILLFLLLRAVILLPRLAGREGGLMSEPAART